MQGQIQQDLYGKEAPDLGQRHKEQKEEGVELEAWEVGWRGEDQHLLLPPRGCCL